MLILNLHISIFIWRKRFYECINKANYVLRNFLDIANKQVDLKYENIDQPFSECINLQLTFRDGKVAFFFSLFFRMPLKYFVVFLFCDELK